MQQQVTLSTITLPAHGQRLMSLPGCADAVDGLMELDVKRWDKDRSSVAESGDDAERGVAA
jgi:hypothetical protein